MLCAAAAGDRRPVSVSSLLISVTPFLLTRPGPRPGPGHAAVLCSELCKLGPGLKYRMLLQSPAAGVYVKNPGDHGTEWAQVFAESPRSAAAAGPGLDTPAAAPVDLALSSLF